MPPKYNEHGKQSAYAKEKKLATDLPGYQQIQHGTHPHKQRKRSQSSDSSSSSTSEECNVSQNTLSPPLPT